MLGGASGKIGLTTIAAEAPHPLTAQCRKRAVRWIGHYSRPFKPVLSLHHMEEPV